MVAWTPLPSTVFERVAVLDFTELLANFAVLFALSWFLNLLARRGRYPRLPEPDPAQEDSVQDRWRWYFASFLALVLGGLAGALLWALPPKVWSDALWHWSPYDQVAPRLLGPFFLVLAFGGLVIVPLAERLVAPGPLLHIMHRAASQAFMDGLDLRPLVRRLGQVAGALAIAAHAGMREAHVTLTAEEVRSRIWPWESETIHAWQDVADIRVVRTFTALSGDVVERPHLVLAFRDGETLRLGRQDDVPRRLWREAAEVAESHTGLKARYLERE